MKTLVIGASSKPDRFSNMAIRALRENNHEVIGLAKREGMVSDVHIQTEFPKDDNIHTVTLYIGAKHQAEYYKSILELKPERVIFNPGTENFELAEMLEINGIETIEGCTLVMLGTGRY